MKTPMRMCPARHLPTIEQKGMFCFEYLCMYAYNVCVYQQNNGTKQDKGRPQLEAEEDEHEEPPTKSIVEVTFVDREVGTDHIM